MKNALPVSNLEKIRKSEGSRDAAYRCLVHNTQKSNTETERFSLPIKKTSQAQVHSDSECPCNTCC